MMSPVDLHTLETLERATAHNATTETPAERLTAWQLAQVQALIPRLRAHSPFYAERLRAVDERGIDSPAALARLPFTLPEELRADPASFLCVAARDVQRIATVATSGSTGAPKRFSFTGGDLDRIAAFFACGMRSLTGEGRHVAIRLSSGTEASVATLLTRALAQIGATASLHGELADAHCVVGLPGDVLRLCRTHPHARPESVLLTADYVSRSAIRAIEHTWSCKAYTHYGMTETGYGLAVQCFAGASHHLRHTDVLTEIVDPHGRPLPPGEVGEVVVTTFTHEAMPLLRYRTGDRSSLDISTCACGGPLPRLGRIEGRAADIAILDEVVHTFDAVRDYRAHLIRRGSEENEKGEEILSLTIDADEHLARRPFEDALRNLSTSRIEFTYKHIPLAPNGQKRRIEHL